jgi:hypothetical protein
MKILKLLQTILDHLISIYLLYIYKLKLTSYIVLIFLTFVNTAKLFLLLKYSIPIMVCFYNPETCM